VWKWETAGLSQAEAPLLRCRRLKIRAQPPAIMLDGPLRKV